MLVYYKLSGVNAVVAMVANLIILLGMMAWADATMTLPGIAGFILTMGMGVDSNVLIFERIKEELAAQRGARAAVTASFDRVLAGRCSTPTSRRSSPAPSSSSSAPGRFAGFALTLFLGLATNLFTSSFVSKTLFELVLSRRPAERAGAEHLGHMQNLRKHQHRFRQVALARDRAVARGRHCRRARHLAAAGCRSASSSPAARSSSSSSSTRAGRSGARRGFSVAERPRQRRGGAAVRRQRPEPGDDSRRGAPVRNRAES